MVTQRESAQASVAQEGRKDSASARRMARASASLEREQRRESGNLAPARVRYRTKRDRWRREEGRKGEAMPSETHERERDLDLFWRRAAEAEWTTSTSN